MRAGAPEGAPDAVVYPGRARSCARCWSCARERSLAVVPFGGGTSVVGGVAPLRGAHAGVVALDMRRLASVLELDRESRTLTVQAGLRAPALEQLLAAQRAHAGPLPAVLRVRVAGRVRRDPLRRAGLDRLRALRGDGARPALAAPAGDIELPALPASAAGPEPARAAGRLGGHARRDHELSLRVRPAPARRVYEGAFFETFAAASQALRALAQRHAAPDVARLSDEPETRMSLALAGAGGLKGRLGRAYLGLRGYRGGCLAILGFEGEPRGGRERRARALGWCARHGGLPVGSSPGRGVAGGALRGAVPARRAADPRRDGRDAGDRHPWSNAGARCTARWAAAIARRAGRGGTPGLVMCHVSHLYETGASLYFTFLARQRRRRDRAVAAVKEAAGQRDHRRAAARSPTTTPSASTTRPGWRGRSARAGVAALRALKAELDPGRDHEPGQAAALRGAPGRPGGARPEARASSVKREGARHHHRTGLAGMGARLARHDQLVEGARVGGKRPAALHDAVRSNRRARPSGLALDCEL